MDRETTAQEVTKMIGQYSIGRDELRRKMLEHFGDDDLQDLAFALDISEEDLPGDTRRDMVRELILYCERRGKLEQLLALCHRERPDFFPAPDTQTELVQAAGMQTTVAKRLAGDDYRTMTLERLAERPESEGRRKALAILLHEFLEGDDNFAQQVASFFEKATLAGDTINQQVTISNGSQAGDIGLKKLLG